MPPADYMTKHWGITQGCSPVGEGCRNCWAATWAKRHAANPTQPHWNADDPMKVVCREDLLDRPRRWKKAQMIGVSFLGDLFHEDVPQEFINRVFEVMAWTPHHRYLVLTKRAHRIVDCVTSFEQIHHPALGREMASVDLRNVWFGASAWDQTSFDAAADAMLPLVDLGLNTWISLEPLLGPINTWNGAAEHWTPSGEPVDCDVRSEIGDVFKWVVVGGESGKNARPMHPQWVRDIRDQCAAAGVPFYFKQGSSFGGNDKHDRTLDGQTHLQLPPSIGDVMNRK